MKKFYENPLIPFALGLFILGFGIKSFFDLPIALYPNTSRPSFAVSVRYDNLTMESFRERFGKNIEARLSALDGVDLVEGSYRENRIRWEVSFAWDTEETKAEVDVKAAVDSLAKAFPESWNYHISANSSVNARLYISLTSEVYSTKELHKKLKEHFLGELNSIKGLDGASFWLPRQEYIRVELKPEELLARNISLSSLKKALSSKSFDENLGDLKTLDKRYDVILPLALKDLDDLKKKLLILNEGDPVYLEDVAHVVFVSSLDRQLMKVDGERALLAVGSMKTSGNITSACREFIQKLSKASDVLGAPVKMRVILNPSLFIESAVRNLLFSILAGVLVAILVIFLFLGSLSQTLVISLSIPLSVLGGFSLMRLLQIDINLISLGALALSVGMVVDGGIVVLENIMRRTLFEKPKNLRERIDLVVSSVGEVKQPLVSSLFTTIIVFAPLSFTAPLANAVLGDLARVMVCVLIISLFVTLYMIPPLTLFRKGDSFLRKEKGIYALSRKTKRCFEGLRRFYLRILSKLLNQGKLSLSLVFFVFLSVCASLYIMKNHVKREILAEPQSDKIWLFVDFFDGKKSLEEAEVFLKKNVESPLEKEFSPYIKHYFSQISNGWASTLLTLKSKDLLEEVKEKLEKRFKHTAKARYYLNPWTPVAFKIPKEPLFKIRISGSSEEKKYETLTALSQFFREQEEVGNFDASPSARKKHYYEILLKEESIRRVESSFRINLRDSIRTLVSSYLEKGVLLRKFSLEGEEYDLKLHFPEEKTKSPGGVENLILRVGDDFYPLRHFATIKAKKKRGNIYTEQGLPVFEVVVWPKESLKVSLKEARATVLERMKEDESIQISTLHFEDPGAEINKSLSSLLWAFFFSLCLILFVLLLQFGAFRDSFLIMSAIPFGLIGVSLSLFAFKSTLSLNSMLGLILLSGTAVNNSILYLDFFKKSYRAISLEELKESLLKASSLRFKPILMTTLTTIFGMLPIALALGDGGEVLQPLGVAVAGGLGVSTLLVLMVLPLILFHLEKRRWV